MRYVAALLALCLVPVLVSAEDGESVYERANEALRESRWRNALDILAPHVNVDTSPADVLSSYARAAYELEDLRLAALAIERGLLRFPTDETLRRLDLAVLSKLGQHEQAQAAALVLLRERPSDSELWRSLAYSAQSLGDTQRSLAAIEAQALLEPDNVEAQQRHIAAQLGAGHDNEAHRAALAIFKQTDVWKKDHDLAALCIAACERASDIEAAWKLLDAIPANERSPELEKARLRLLLIERKHQEAAVFIEELQAKNRLLDPEIYWLLGQLYEFSDKSKALSAYRQAQTMGHETSTLYIARLLMQLRRDDEARDELQSYLTKNPADHNARAMLRIIEDPK